MPKSNVPALRNPVIEVSKLSISQLETQVEENLPNFYVLGAALVELRDRKEYLKDYPSFHAYVLDRFKISKSSAFRMMRSAGVDEMECQVGTPIKNQAQAEALGRLPASKQKKAIEKAAKEAAKEGRKMTAADVKKAAAEEAPEKFPKKKPLKAPPPAPESVASLPAPATETPPAVPLPSDKGTLLAVRDYGLDASKMDPVHGPALIKDVKLRHHDYWMSLSMVRLHSHYKPLYATFEEYLASELGLTLIIAPAPILSEGGGKKALVQKVSALGAAQASFERTQAAVTADRLPAFAGRLRLWFQGRTSPYGSGAAMGKCDSEVMRKVEELLKEVGV